MTRRDITLRSILLEKLDRVLNPNFEKKYISSLFLAGLGLIGYQRVINLIGQLELVDEGIVFRLALSSATDYWLIGIGLLLIASSTFFFYRVHFFPREKAISYIRLKDAALELRKILDENRRIFINYGPNSSAGSTAGVRYDMAQWESFKRDIIVPNNDKILSILEKVEAFEGAENLPVQLMKNHINSFKLHCENPNFDYRQHQFPLAFSDLIFNYSRASSKESANLEKYIGWLKLNIQKYPISIESLIVFGSALYGEESTDVDFLIKTKTDNLEEIHAQAKMWEDLSTNFKKTFGLRAHLTVFSSLEQSPYKAFLEKIPDYREA